MLDKIHADLSVLVRFESPVELALPALSIDVKGNGDNSMASILTERFVQPSFIPHTAVIFIFFLFFLWQI